MNTKYGITPQRKGKPFPEYALAIERLREVLRLDPATGTLYWRIQVGTRGVAGEEALVTRSGTRDGSIDNVPIKACRAVFALHHGRWPVTPIGFVDLNRSNLIPENLFET